MKSLEICMIAVCVVCPRSLSMFSGKTESVFRIADRSRRLSVNAAIILKRPSWKTSRLDWIEEFSTGPWLKSLLAVIFGDPVLSSFDEADCAFPHIILCQKLGAWLFAKLSSPIASREAAKWYQGRKFIGSVSMPEAKGVQIFKPSGILGLGAKHIWTS